MEIWVCWGIARIANGLKLSAKSLQLRGSRCSKVIDRRAQTDDSWPARGMTPTTFSDSPAGLRDYPLSLTERNDGVRGVTLAKIRERSQ